MMKYVILEDLQTPVLFPDYVFHKDMAKLGKIVSAGFWNEREAYGKSVSLGIKSRPEDTEIIERHLYGRYPHNG